MEGETVACAYPEWDTADRRSDLNHFMARLIFCYFAEDTAIFHGSGLFTATVDQMSARDSSNTHEIISELFRAMNTPLKERTQVGIRSWANLFPYVNGGLFSGSADVPVGTKRANEGVGAPGMPANLREAHERNDETLERIYIGRRFKNDTERLEKIFELYTQMAGSANVLVGKSRTSTKRRRKA